MVAGGERLQDLTIAVLGNGETSLELVSIALLLLRDYEGDTFKWVMRPRRKTP